MLHEYFWPPCRGQTSFSLYLLHIIDFQKNQILELAILTPDTFIYFPIFNPARHSCESRNPVKATHPKECRL